MCQGFLSFGNGNYVFTKATRVFFRLEETFMKIDGGCHCGYITYVAEIDPDKAGICHCTDCQTLAGSAFRMSVSAARDAVSVRGGQPMIHVTTADSGPIV